MPYRVVIEKSVAKSIDKLDASPRKQILLVLKDLATSDAPRNDSKGKALQGDKRLWSYRVGIYRIIADIADINDKTITITIVKAGHRSKVYEGL
jgi:mRNA-degrading endonuclease RelE of RelBE toxin-antitoxin system